MAITQREISEHLDLSTQAVSDFIKAGGLGAKWKEMTIDEIRIFYLRRMRLRAMGRTGEGDEFDGIKEKSRLLHHQANLAELEVEVKKGNLIPAEKVRERWAEMITAFRAKMLAIPTRTASAAVGKDIVEIESLVRKLVNEALDELNRHS